MLTKFHERSFGSKNWQKLTEGLPAAWKVDGGLRKVSWRYKELPEFTEILLTAQKVNRMSPGHKKS